MPHRGAASGTGSGPPTLVPAFHGNLLASQSCVRALKRAAGMWRRTLQLASMEQEVGNEALSLRVCGSGSVFACFGGVDRRLPKNRAGHLVGHFDSPASMSMLEESTLAVNRPTMGVFNNLVVFKQDEPQNTPTRSSRSLRPAGRWCEEGTELTFPLQQGVKWHDGKPFTAADVKCTIELLQGTRRKNCGSTRANRGLTMSLRCPPTAITRSLFT